MLNVTVAFRIEIDVMKKTVSPTFRHETQILPESQNANILD